MYIVTCPEFIVKNSIGEKIKEPKRVVCYSMRIGRRRYYRQGIDSIDKGMKILSFKKEKNAIYLRDNMLKIENGSKREVEKIL